MLSISDTKQLSIQGDHNSVEFTKEKNVDAIEITMDGGANTETYKILLNDILEMEQLIAWLVQTKDEVIAHKNEIKDK